MCIRRVDKFCLQDLVLDQEVAAASRSIGVFLAPFLMEGRRRRERARATYADSVSVVFPLVAPLCFGEC